MHNDVNKNDTISLEGRKRLQAVERDASFSWETNNSVDNLLLENKFLTSIDLSPLSLCTRLEKLSLGNNNLESIDLSPLSNCASLETLWMYKNRLKTLDLSPLQHCKNLNSIDFSNNELEYIDLSPLASWPALQNVVIGGNPLKELDLSPLKKVPKLEYVSIDETHLRELDLSPLSGCSSLKDLSLAKNNVQSLDLTPLEHCQNLETLRLDHITSESVLDLTPLSKCPNLRRIGLEKPIFNRKRKFVQTILAAHESAASILKRIVYPRGAPPLVSAERRIKWLRDKPRKKIKQKEKPTLEHGQSSLYVSLCPICEGQHDIRLKLVHAITHSEKESVSDFKRKFQCPIWHETFDYKFAIKCPPGSKVHIVEEFR